MGRVIVIEFITVDGVVSDPDGSAGTATGGWAFRHGPEAVAGDKFQLGEILDSAVLLLGRVTWQQFARIWPGRSDPFATAMNAVPKLVATRSSIDTSAWAGSVVLRGDLREAVDDHRRHRDVIVAGSLSVVRTLMAQDLVDEYRLLTFPTVAGVGQRLFPDQRRPIDLVCHGAQQTGAAALVHYHRAR